MIERRLLLGAGAALALARPALAWPDRTVRLLVGFAPGGAVDTVARLIAGPMGETLGQTQLLGGALILAAVAVAAVEIRG